MDAVIAMVGVLIEVELARRVVGSDAPELFAHAGESFPELCTSIFYESDGVFGIMAHVLATYVLLFVLFGAFLEK